MLAEAKEVCPSTTRRMLESGALMIDVREAAEAAAFAFDVPALVNIPLSELERRWEEVPRGRPVVFACESGARSLKATYHLQFHGYDNVSNMSGGIVKWSAKGFPVKGARSPCGCATGCCEPSAAESSACCGEAAAPTSCC